ncbi:hypothetical protein ACE1AT_26420 [Pelatocladus sp. BLCC-F211]|uniref:hypothetical protein n=1 Tax=Pelatocladus sp. BLCC-F211 TaxID=3342752 RepID=UPI0035B725A2
MDSPRHEDTKVYCDRKTNSQNDPFVKTTKFLSESGNKDIVDGWLLVVSGWFSVFSLVLLTLHTPTSSLDLCL